MYTSDLHVRALSELFPWGLDWGLVIVFNTEVFTCWSSHFPLVSHLSLSSDRHYQTASGSDEGSEHSGNNVRSVKKPRYDAAGAHAKHSSADSVSPLQ